MAWPHKPKTHGANVRGNRKPEYNVWAKMRQRCENPNSKDYKNYGGRGIGVCEQWSDFSIFYRDMGDRPSEAHTIERVDNDKGYSPDNCIWATRDVQARNKRPRKLAESCSKGHSLGGDNLYMRPDGKRACRECRRAAMAKFYERKAA
jgi:hypothetical protein